MLTSNVVHTLHSHHELEKLLRPILSVNSVLQRVYGHLRGYVAVDQNAPNIVLLNDYGCASHKLFYLCFVKIVVEEICDAIR